MIAIVDYGLGNVHAFANIYKKMNMPATIAASGDALLNAQKIILPGVGSFDWAMTRLNESGIRDSLDDMVIHRGIPVLGICIGMQMMAKRSDEGELNGLGWIDGVVERVDFSMMPNRIPLPHMGWNNINPTQDSRLFKGLGDEHLFYYLHSYCFHCNNADDEIAFTEYGNRFTCAVNSENIYGVQFHPEKSHQWGIQLLKNFGDI